MNIIELIAKSCEARKVVTKEHASQYDAIIAELERKLPCSNGFERGCKINVTNSNSEQVVILFDYHHKNERGLYTKWTTHKLTVRPCFNGLNIKIASAKQYGLEDVFCEVFKEVLLKPL